MATLVFTALGTAIGGPLGGAVGSLIGNQIDRAVMGGGRREGPRLKELSVTASSYGTPVPRHFGTMRAAGTIIWATDLFENSEKSGGGKGAPSTQTYSYSASFAVALASRPILRLGRVWADGNLLRGSAGDLKVGGQLRVYQGHGDQQPDPLIASDRAGQCPAFRGLAYCVFEGLQLADFGNRIPALSFEIVAGDGAITIADLVETLTEPVAEHWPLDGLAGFSDEGGELGGLLATVDQLFPLSCDAGGAPLSLRAVDQASAGSAVLGPAAVDETGEGSGAGGHLRKRQAEGSAVPQGVRYYDISRDYQASVQRVDGQAPQGRARTIEFPGAFEASSARSLIDRFAARARSARETLSWRTAELDPALSPGMAVRVPDHPGEWLIESWEWGEWGVELELRRLPPRAGTAAPADAGQALAKSDLVAAPTQLVAFELPWSGQGSGDRPEAFAAVSSVSAGWTGAALYFVQSGELIPLASTGPRRSVIGRTAGAVAPSSALLFEAHATVDVELASADFDLAGATPRQLAEGANRAVLGDEVVQFASAVRIDGSLWRLCGLLRGRGGTEAAALAGHGAATPFALIGDAAVSLDPDQLGRSEPTTLAALGLADNRPVLAQLLNPGATTRPLSPVHPSCRRAPDGSLRIAWIRRSRGAWSWSDGIEVPLNEEAERYLVGIGDPDAPSARWEFTEPELVLSAPVAASLAAEFPGQAMWVRQIGRFAPSDPLRLPFDA